ncbi:MAG: MopE-related protein [Saprospiraceae bacterium]
MIDDDSVPGNCLPSTETITRTFMVGYDCGYSTTCTQVITLEDNTPPLIVTCPDDQTIEWPTGFNTYLVGPNTPQDPSIDPSNYNNMVYSEACGSVTITYQDVLTGPNPGNCPNLWVVERTWTVTDQCNQSTQCVQTFTFTDTTPPTISCPADPAPIEWPAGFNTAAVGPNTPQDPSVAPAVYGTATASDNCGTPTVTYQDVLFGPVPGDCPNLWTLQRTWTATDACGLTATCVQVFTFTDTTPPVITTCPPAVAIEGCGLGDIAGNGHPPYSTVVAGTEAEFSGSGGVASDNCAIVAWNYMDVASGTCPATVTRTWTVTDACGLTATCTQVFTIDDTTPPLVTCQDISVSLGANGTYNLQPTEVLASASDNCGGAVTPVSVSPSIFDCQSFPNNTVTLTVEDACGNPGTCTANVYVAPFITNVIGVHTNETCAGANDGTITASATAGGGQVMYSVDGVNFQAVGSFNNLAPGLQTLTIKVFGVPATCVETLVFDIQPGGPLLVCYADSDNDGYGSSIAPPVTTCNCPAGYKTAAQLGGNTNNDCNDGNALINPGAAEICDGLDNDCDGIVPADEVDADGDGYRVCDNDCNDTNPAINPGAAEICNGLDDNCNGMVDEGLNGLTYNGNVYFSTQAQVDAWPPCYSVINGSVTIVGVGINNLGPLSNIVDITGGLTIQSTGLTSMSGLDGLAHVGGTLTIYFNSSLTTLNGLEALNAVGGALYMYYNFQLSDCCAISDLVSGGVTGAMLVFFNKAGCNSVTEIITTCPTNNPLIGNPNNSIGTQAATGATYSKVGAAAAVSVYPNPVRSVLTVNIAAELLSGTLQVTDVAGRTRTIVELVEGQSIYNLDVSEFGVGLYFVTVKMEGAEPVVKRFVVE